MKKAMKIAVSGELSPIEYTDDTSLDMFQQGVGGLIQAVELPKLGLTMWLDEEGKLKRKPHNPTGQAIWNYEYGLTDVIVGDVLLTPGGCDEEGNTHSFSDDDMFILNTLLAALATATESSAG